MTLPTPSSPAPSEPEASALRRSEERTRGVEVPLTTHRRRSADGESFVVIASVPPHTNLVIQVSAARGPHDTASKLAGVTVAVRAVPVSAGPTELLEPTRLAPTEPPASGVSRSPTQVLSPNEARAAQDTMRYAAQAAHRTPSGLAMGWFSLSAACLVASVVGAFALLPAERPVATAPLPAATVSTASAIPLEAASAAPPARVNPSAHLELNGLSLDVTASPWMDVHVDGKSVGNTPRSALTLTPGRHAIELVNPALSLRARTELEAHPAARESRELAFE